MGSPPRMRGKLFDIYLMHFLRQDHPRVCGENLLIHCPYLYSLGSPPRMRGKLTAKPFFFTRFGITPAYAGKTQRPRISLSVIQDHPRVCGENVFRDQLGKNLMGSPPRMRGKLMLFPSFQSVSRITPAYAGKTKHAANRVNLLRDHPRVCGENRLSLTARCRREGSPPRMRGKPSITLSLMKKQGITPAYAGKTPI